MCKFCEYPLRQMQVKGGGKYGSADIVGDRLFVSGDTSGGAAFRASLRIKCCPMCGRRLNGRKIDDNE